MAPVFLGGLLRFFAERKSSDAEETSLRREKGVLLGSGFVGGEGLLGVGIAGVAVILKQAPEGIGYDWAGRLAPGFSALALALLAWTFWRLIKKV